MKIRIAEFEDLEDRVPKGVRVADVDLVVTRWDDQVSVLYGRCLHRGALLADGRVEGMNLICGLHDWDYRLDTGVSEYNNAEALERFEAWVEDGGVFVEADDIATWATRHPQPYDREAYQGNYADVHGTPDEAFVREIQGLARHGLERVGHHGPVASMGVPRRELPSWDDLQLLPAQLARLPRFEEEEVDTRLVLGPEAKKPLVLDIPLFVSDMSFGALSAEAKIALARGAELAGTGICSGEGGMLPEEREANGRYLYELASARFGFSMDKLAKVQAFHFKGGQGAKTGTGGHLPGNKVRGRIAEVRGLEEGQPAVSPPRFRELDSPSKFREFADAVRVETGGIPIGFKLSANHIEEDLDAALEVGVDYVILDGRGGGTGAAPTIFRDHISIPTTVAVARARRHLDRRGRGEVTLIATGGLRVAADFVKALALGADGVALANSAMQAIGCLGMRACHTNNCPVGIATQQPHLRARLEIERSARQLQRFLGASTEIMKVASRACGHVALADLCPDDLTSWKRETSELCGVRFAGVGAPN